MPLIFAKLGFAAEPFVARYTPRPQNAAYTLDGFAGSIATSVAASTVEEMDGRPFES